MQSESWASPSTDQPEDLQSVAADAYDKIGPKRTVTKDRENRLKMNADDLKTALGLLDQIGWR